METKNKKSIISLICLAFNTGLNFYLHSKSLYWYLYPKAMKIDLDIITGQNPTIAQPEFSCVACVIDNGASWLVLQRLAWRRIQSMLLPGMTAIVGNLRTSSTQRITQVLCHNIKWAIDYVSEKGKIWLKECGRMLDRKTYDNSEERNSFNFLPGQVSGSYDDARLS